MTELITLSGKCKGGFEIRNKLGEAPKFSLFSLSGSSGILNIDPRTLSNEDAGIWYLTLLESIQPGVTWQEIFQLANNQVLGAKWYERFGSTIVDGVRTVIKGAGAAVLNKIPDGKVKDTISKYGSDYASPGGKAAARLGFLTSLGGLGQTILKKLGLAAKKSVASTPADPDAASAPDGAPAGALTTMEPRTKQMLLWGGLGLGGLALVMFLRRRKS